MTAAITIHDLGKSYGGRAVVEGLDLHVPEGCVYGFLGPNGSGKSTTMKMLLALVRPTRGGIELFGRPLRRSTRRALLAETGSLIESPPGYGHLTGGENTRLVQRLLGLDDRQIDRAVRTVRLENDLDRLVGHYSLGMKQRLGIAMALAREPRLLILDEPTNGLDPAGIEEIRDLLARLAASGTTVMVSSPGVRPPRPMCERPPASPSWCSHTTSGAHTSTATGVRPPQPMCGQHRPPDRRAHTPRPAHRDRCARRPTQAGEHHRSHQAGLRARRGGEQRAGGEELRPAQPPRVQPCRVRELPAAAPVLQVDLLLASTAGAIAPAAVAGLVASAVALTVVAIASTTARLEFDLPSGKANC